ELMVFGQAVKSAKGEKFQIKGSAGSQASFLVAALYRLTERNIVIVLNDKEEALYLQNDLKSIMPRKEVFLFPASYKRPYQVEEIDNANILQRAEVLNELNHTRSGRQVVITFAEALYEKVLNKRSLVKNTLEIKVGQELGQEFILEILEEYGFEREDYVFEPGQYAIRGGILDVYSFAHDLPYRIEFFGDEIDNIRTFDPVEQTSQEKVKRVSLIPNIQRQLLTEEQVSFLEYLSPNTLVIARNVGFVEADLQRLYQKAETAYEGLVGASGGAATSKEPKDLYFSPDSFRQQLKQFSVVEINNDPYYQVREATLAWKGSAQPAFHKEFSLLSKHFEDNQEAEVRTLVLSENAKQLARLEEIFESIEKPDLFEGVKGDIHEGFLDQKLNIAVYTDHQIFDRYHRYKSNSNVQRSQAITLQELRELNPGDFVEH
ncbi:MAG: transcription-repair coupling factor, partial [Bacteroidota bacterium]